MGRALIDNTGVPQRSTVQTAIASPCALADRGLTRRSTVVPYRVRRLLSLQKRIGPEPAVIALLSCYKLYCPHLLSLVVTGNRKRWFPTLDRALNASVLRVQARRGVGVDAAVSSRASMEFVHKQQELPSGIPTLHSQLPENSARLVLDHMDSFEQVAAGLDNLELPMQLAAVMNDTRLQHVLSCMPRQTSVRRIGHWLAVRLVDQAVHSGEETPSFAALLKSLASFAEFMQASACLGVLIRVLHAAS